MMNDLDLASIHAINNQTTNPQASTKVCTKVCTKVRTKVRTKRSWSQMSHAKPKKQEHTDMPKQKPKQNSKKALDTTQEATQEANREVVEALDTSRDKGQTNLSERVTREKYVKMCVKALGVPKLVRSVLQNKRIKAKLLSKCDGTALLRVASLKECPEFAKLVFSHFGVVGVPFKLRLDGEQSNFALFKHQQRTVNFLHRASKANNVERFLEKVKNTRGALVVMKMGLGKTVTALTHALSTPRCPENAVMGELGFPVLIVAPKSVLPMWRDDGVEKFFEPNSLKVLYMHEDFMPKAKLDQLERRDIIKYDLVVTTYEVVRSGGEGLDADQVELDQPMWCGKKLIFGTRWRLVVLDESQRIANLNKTARALRLVRGKDHLCLSGTPMRNSPQDLCAQFMWMGYTGVSNAKQFTQRHMTEHFLNERMCVVSHADTDLVLPPRTHTTVLLDATPRERQVYDLIRDHARRELCGPVVDYVCWLAVLTGLRQVCTAPFLVSRKVQPSKVDVHLVAAGVPNLAERRKRTQAFAAGIKNVLKKDQELWQDLQDPLGEFGVKSTKVVAIVDTILKAVANKDKVVVFSIWVTTLEVVALALDQQGFKRTKLGSLTNSSSSTSSSLASTSSNLASSSTSFSFSSSSSSTSLATRAKRARDSDSSYVLLHGGTRDRSGVLREFKLGSCSVLLVTHGVGGEGIDLTAASCVICAEQWWTPVVHDQAFARVWRPGQKRPVCLHDFVFKNTIEEYMHKMCSAKTEESKLFVYTKKGQPVIRFNASDLASMLG